LIKRSRGCAGSCCRLRNFKISILDNYSLKCGDSTENSENLGHRTRGYWWLVDTSAECVLKLGTFRKLLYENCSNRTLHNRQICEAELKLSVGKPIAMTKVTINSAQTLPRFLLPRLSWQTRSSLPPHTIRTLSTIPSSNWTSPRASVPQNVNNQRQPKPSILQNPSCRRAFHATPRQSRDHHFDTLKFVQRLKDDGFTEEQAVAMMKVLSDVIEERYSTPLPPLSPLLPLHTPH
jgi:hypothetical protein